MSECKAYRREIEEAADVGLLSAPLRAHVSACRACAESLRERESVRALVSGLGRVGAPADFEFRLRARMAAVKTEGGRGRFGGARWLYGFAPVALAACFFIVSATLYFRQAARPASAGTPVAVSNPAPSAEPVRVAPVNDEHETASAPAVTDRGVAPAKQIVVSFFKAPKSSRQLSTRVRQAREVAAKVERPAADEPGTIVSSVTAAPVISLKTSNESLRVILRDERGAARVVPMRSVSFGSQDFLSRGATAKPAAAIAQPGGVW